MDYKIFILNKLLEKYENSKSYNGACNRRILLKISGLKEYKLYDYEEKANFHEAVFDLHRNALIDFNWEKFEENNILNEIWLNTDNVEKAYEYGKRPNIKNQVKEMLSYIESADFEQDYLKEFRSDAIAYMNDKGKEFRLLPYEYYKQIIEGLIFIQNEDTILERTFSVKCFGDSKFFERNIKNIIVRIIKVYKLKDEENILDNEALLSVGISRYPEIIEFNGNISIQFKSGFESDYNTLLKGAYINSESVKIIEAIDLKEIKRVLFIENKANYVDYITKHQKENELVIYHGGMYSPIKGDFFKQIFESTPNVEYYHWSDIDLGGFRIFERLKNNIINTLKPYNIDVKSFDQKRDYWIAVDDKYIDKLSQLLKDCTYKEFWDLITKVIDEKAKLEQETFIS